jgi:hypothetical protein
VLRKTGDVFVGVKLVTFLVIFVGTPALVLATTPSVFCNGVSEFVFTPEYEKQN